MKDLIFTGIILLIIGGAVAYIRNARKKGVKCIGCSAGKTCAAKGKCPSENNTDEKAV